MHDGVKIVVKQAFSAYGVDYPVGGTVDPLVAKKWPKGTIARRFSNGFVEYAHEEPEIEEEDVIDEEEELNKPDDLSTKTKDELAEYALAKFNLEVSTNQSRAKMLAAIEEAASASTEE